MGDPDGLPTWMRLAIAAVFGLGPLMLVVFVWWRGFVFRLTVTPTRIELKDVLRTTSIAIDHNLQIRHRNESHSLNGIPTAKHVYMTFESGGERITVNSNVKNVDELQARMIDIESRVILPAMRGRHNAGAPATFGPITLQGSQLRRKNKVEEISSLKIELADGYFIARKDGAWLAVIKEQLMNIPNAATLCTLINEAKAARPGQRAG